ncbi:type II toxin-antitoxin system PemK/MazF family toxin [Listeria valentina]|uniref:type II toxin-antitoxin system PemK/MazF family toxin n=1 Tax=Listeria valentina TaxID=2705293 RepID=UPI001FE9339E|nr:type II toxin-antitoxin system PemK/MazF family toxin [Listeria valentina]
MGVTYIPRQGDLVTLDFEPSKGYEIGKKRPALVMSTRKYNRSTHLVIVCPITSTEKERPFLVPVESDSFHKKSKVNTNQVFSLDYTEEAGRGLQFIDRMEEEVFYMVAQKFLFNFEFPFS